MKFYKYPITEERTEIKIRPIQERPDVRERVEQIVEAVRSGGDAAIQEFTRRFDGVDLPLQAVSRETLSRALAELEPSLRKAIELAIRNIKTFHKAQYLQAQAEDESYIETQPGVTCTRLLRAIERVGLYVPGGSAPLFSTLLMLAVPALLAGAKEIVVVTPPQQNRDYPVTSVVLAAAALLGITEVYPIGGAQAIAALAFGTKTVRAVDKIFGPGNSYVDLAKQIVTTHPACRVGIDLPAGPSEVCIIADDSARIELIVADLLAQAEHGPDSQVVLLTTSTRIFEGLQAELARQTKLLPRRAICEKSLLCARAALLNDLNEALNLSNEYAPEHLILAVNNAQQCLEKVTSAGSVFVGELAAESFGDYASGTNHVLPTVGWARVTGGVSVASFQKWITVQRLTQEGVDGLAPTVALLARAEGLEGHARAAELRMTKYVRGGCNV